MGRPRKNQLPTLPPNPRALGVIVDIQPQAESERPSAPDIPSSGADAERDLGENEIRNRLIRIMRHSPDDRAVLEAIKVLRDMDAPAAKPADSDAPTQAIFSLPAMPTVTRMEPH
jgi:hypothetical protein